jgi:hypothetical protein
MNRHHIVTGRIFLLYVAFFLAVAVGCAPIQTKPTGEQAETTSIREGEREIRKGVTQEHLQAMLMDFADTFASKYGRATTFLIEQESSPDRVHAARLRFYWIYSAFFIASDRNPTINLVDMVILVALSRIVWEEYWQPEVFGDSAQAVVKTLKELEEDIWTLATKVLTPEQQKELRLLIHEWRKKNPDQHWVGFIRLSNILELVGEDSVFQKETQPGGLFAPITEATEAVDEIRFSAERAMYLVSRMQAILIMQAETVYHDIATQQEVRQVLSDITGFREIAERLPAQISEERKNIMRDLESQEKTIRNVVGDIREMMKEGNDLISLVNETTKTVGGVSERIDTMIRTPSLERPFDIMDYQNTVLAASDTLKQANSFLDSFDRTLTAQVIKNIVAEFDQVAENRVNHIFWRLAVLLVIFCASAVIIVIVHHLMSQRGRARV